MEHGVTSLVLNKKMATRDRVTPVDLEDGALVVEVDAGSGAPVEYVGRQHALHQGRQALLGAHLVQLLEQVREHLQRRRILPLLVQPGI